jgi:hypothetical protein
MLKSPGWIGRDSNCNVLKLFLFLRPMLDNSWIKSEDVNSVAYEPGLDVQQSSSQKSGDATEFDGLKRMFTNREKPSLSPHTSRQDLTVISIDDPQEKVNFLLL